MRITGETLQVMGAISGVLVVLSPALVAVGVVPKFVRMLLRAAS